MPRFSNFAGPRSFRQRAGQTARTVPTIGTTFCLADNPSGVGLAAPFGPSPPLPVDNIDKVTQQHKHDLQKSSAQTRQRERMDALIRLLFIPSDAEKTVIII